MSLNQAYLERLERELKKAEAADLGVTEPNAGDTADLTNPTQQTDVENGQATSEPSTTTAQDDNEVTRLRQELANSAAELAALKTARETGEPEQQPEDDIALYETEEERQELIDALGEDLVLKQERMLTRAFRGIHSKSVAKINALEQHNQTLEISKKSADFIKVAGDALKTFNDPQFQAFAKGEKLGRKSLFDELHDIVTGNDLTGAEFLIEQAQAYQGANKVTRRAQIGAGRNLPVTDNTKPTYSREKAEKLERDVKKHRMGTTEFNAAKKKYDEYLMAAH
jgi:ribosomal protein L16 Arg81 hydroxylase